MGSHIVAELAEFLVHFGQFKPRLGRKILAGQDALQICQARCGDGVPGLQSRINLLQAFFQAGQAVGHEEVQREQAAGEIQSPSLPPSVFGQFQVIELAGDGSPEDEEGSDQYRREDGAPPGHRQ